MMRPHPLEIMETRQRRKMGPAMNNTKARQIVRLKAENARLRTALTMIAEWKSDPDPILHWPTIVARTVLTQDDERT